MESQFIERNGNLKKSLNSIVDKIDNVSFEFLCFDWITNN
jgi:hypothetical protein